MRARGRSCSPSPRIAIPSPRIAIPAIMELPALVTSKDCSPVGLPCGAIPRIQGSPVGLRGMASSCGAEAPKYGLKTHSSTHGSQRGTLSSCALTARKCTSGVSHDSDSHDSDRNDSDRNVSQPQKPSFDTVVRANSTGCRKTNDHAEEKR